MWIIQKLSNGDKVVIEPHEQLIFLGKKVTIDRKNEKVIEESKLGRWNIQELCPWYAFVRLL